MGNVGKWVSWLILKIEMGHLRGWGTWSMWSCALSCATSLVLDILTSFNLNHLSPSQGYFWVVGYWAYLMYLHNPDEYLVIGLVEGQYPTLYFYMQKNFDK